MTVIRHDRDVLGWLPSKSPDFVPPGLASSFDSANRFPVSVIGSRRVWASLIQLACAVRNRMLSRGGWLAAWLLISGCAGSPLATLNPVLRDQWAHDEKFGPTTHTKIAELDALRTAAAELPPAQQQENAAILLRILHEEPSTVLLSHAILALAEFPTESSLEGLRWASDHSDPEIRITACRAWRRKQSPEALEQLCKILGSDTDLDVRLAAADQLQYFRDSMAIDALGIALDDTNPAVQHRALASLKVITGKDLGNNVAAWRQLQRDGKLVPDQTPSLTERIRSWF